MQGPVTDSENRCWTLGRPLGRGLWARAHRLEGPEGASAVLKIPLTLQDLGGPADDDARALAAACRAALEHQIAWLREVADDPLVGDLAGTLRLPDGATGLVLPDHGPSLAARRPPIARALDLALAIGHALQEAPRPHGQLRPSNVFVGDDGSLRLTDWLTPPVGALRSPLLARAGIAGWLPPDPGPRPAVGDDTWAVARWLLDVLLDDPPDVASGLQRDARVRERLVQRLIAEDGLPRFVDRTADRLATMLGRALSRESEPSPPFRYLEWAPLIERLQEARALLEPRVEDVGPVVWPTWRPDETFGGEEPVAFSVRVGGSPGLEEPGDIVCGLRVEALSDDAEPRRVPVPGAAVQVRSERAARYRFRLELPPLPAGRYRLTAAFAVEGTGAVPRTTAATFTVDPGALGAGPSPVPEGAFDRDRTTLVPDAPADLDGLAELPDPRMSEEPAPVDPFDGEASLPPAFEAIPPPPSTDRGVAWVLGLSAALAVVAVLSYVARSF